MNKRKKIIAFSSILLVTTGLQFVVFATLWNNKETTEDITPKAKKDVAAPMAGASRVLGLNEALNSKLAALQQSDKLYAVLLTAPRDKKKMDSVTQLIHRQEESLRAAIDSNLLNLPNQSDADLKKLAENIIGSYGSILQSRIAFASLRNAIDLDQKTLSPDDMAILKIQNESQEKNNRIASLEASLKSMAADKGNGVTEKRNGKAVDVTTTVVHENTSMLEDRIASLITLNSSLKQDNDKLLKQQTDASKSPGNTETLIKNKVASLQQRVDALNAELSLAQVDCNLSRVDAAQIISNSKQRKQLLTEASGILTNLANTDDALIRKKVQDKIIRLNQVAANTRD